MNRFIKISLIIILIIISVEAGIYFYYLKDKTPSKNFLASILKQDLSIPSPTNKPTDIDDNLLLPENVEFFTNIKKNDHEKLYLIMEVNGWITKLQYSKENNLYVLEIGDENKQKIRGVMINENEISKYKIENSKKQNITFSDLKVGDQILYITKTRMGYKTDSQNTFEIYIEQ